MSGTLIIGLELPFRIISTSQTLGLLAVLLTGSLALAQDRPKAKRHYGPEYTQRTFKGTPDGELKHGWPAPLNPKAGEKHPLVICLHGPGGSVRASSVLARDEMRENFQPLSWWENESRPVYRLLTDALGRRQEGARPTDKLPLVIDTVRVLIQTEAIDPGASTLSGSPWAAREPGPPLRVIPISSPHRCRPADSGRLKMRPRWCRCASHAN